MCQYTDEPFGKTITDIPDDLDPVVLIYDRMRTCPFCSKKAHVYRRDTLTRFKDRYGKKHIVLRWLNKYEWMKLRLECEYCGAKWETEWFPHDHKLFEFKI